MAVSPVENRYSTKMNELFDERAKLQRWLDVEAALAEAHADVGNIPKWAAREIKRKANVRYVKIERVKEIDRRINHDLMALVKALAEQCGEAGGYVHLGATSYDVEDTATALMFKDALGLIRERLKELKKTLLSLAKKHSSTVCVGRTHGQHAVPTTYGMKFALWASELQRHLDRMEEVESRISVGKMSGAVGTMATFGPKAFEIQRRVMRKLGLKPALITNQIIQRDRHAEVLFLLALISCTLEKMAKEVRNLQRTEIMEVAEPISKKQVGSSTMPQKRNPHKCERICSLARVIRANLFTALENIALEHERDLTNSASERVIFPESFILTDYMLSQMDWIMKGLEFFPKNIERNLRMTRGAIMAERAMMIFVRRGMGRQEAHEIIRRAARRAFESGRTLEEELMKERKVRRLLSEEDLKEIFNEMTYIGKAEEIVRMALRELRR